MDLNSRTLTATCCFSVVLVREGAWEEKALATYALIPGGGGDPWEWHRLVSELTSRGQHAIAVRLPADDDTAGRPSKPKTMPSSTTTTCRPISAPRRKRGRGRTSR